VRAVAIYPRGENKRNGMLVGLTEARKRFLSLVEAALRGEEVILTNRGKLFARIETIPDQEAQLTGGKVAARRARPAKKPKRRRNPSC
jgi:antitoxin (DNA-binding transcriptional repressor) of toxin-antitoxin stability system